MKIILTMLLFLHISVLANTLDKINVAVNDLSGQTIDAPTMLILSDRVRSELIQTGAFTVVERSEMASILEEMDFQMSGMCDESSCLVEMGQMLGVDRIVAGSIGKLNESFYTVSLRMIDIGTGQISSAANYDHHGDLPRLLSGGIRKAVANLVKGAGAEIKDATYRGKSGDLYIASSLDGATITINGKKQKQLTPAMFEKYPAGPFVITVAKGSYVGTYADTLEPNDLEKVSIEMKKEKVTLLLKSSPMGAKVVIDGKEFGSTPLKLENLHAGTQALSLSLPNYVPVTETLTLSNKPIQKKSITLSPAAYLKVTSKPEGSTVAINNKTLGQTPLDVTMIPSGSIKVSVHQENYDTLLRKEVVQPGDTLYVASPLLYSYAKVDITTMEGAKIALNEAVVGTGLWKEDKLTPGLYTLKISKENYAPLISEIEFQKGEQFKKAFPLALSKEAKNRQHKKRQWIRRAAFGALAVGGLSAGIYFNGIAEEERTAYDSYKGGNAAAHKENWQAIEDAKTKRTVSYIGAAIGAVGLSISIPF